MTQRNGFFLMNANIGAVSFHQRKQATFALIIMVIFAHPHRVIPLLIRYHRTNRIICDTLPPTKEAK